jgi:hypothetical protein
MPFYPGHGLILIDGSGTALAQRPRPQFAGATLTDDPTNGRTVVIISPAAMAAIPFEAMDFEDGALVIPAEFVGFTYEKVIVQVFDGSGNQVLCGVAVGGTDQSITLTDDPFDGEVLVTKVA